VRKSQIIYAQNAIFVSTPYNPDFVSELKTLPKEKRMWNPEFKMWIIHPDCREKVEEMFKKFFADFEEMDVQEGVKGVGFNQKFEIIRVITDVEMIPFKPLTKWEREIEEILKAKDV